MKFNGFLIIYLLSMPIVANEVRNDKLLPEVQHLLAIPDLNENDLAQNGYVDLLALDAPENSDYMAIAKKVLIKNNQLLQEAINQQDVKLFKNVVTTADYYQNKSLSTNMGYGIEYEFPCASLKKLHCVDQIIRDREQLEAVIKRNATILMRYKRAQAKPYYKVYPLSAEMPICLSHKFTRLMVTVV